MYRQKDGKLTTSSVIQIYINRINNKVELRIKTGFILVLFMSKAMRLLGSIVSNTNNYENGKNVPNLDTAVFVLANYNVVGVQYFFFFTKQIIWTTKQYFIIVNIFKHIPFFWFTDQIIVSLEIGGKINLT